MIESIAQTKNMSADQLKLATIENSADCKNDIGYIISSEKMKFVVCLKTNKVVEYNIVDCKELGTRGFIRDSWDMVKKNLLGG